MFYIPNVWKNQTTINMLKARFCRMLNAHERNDERKAGFLPALRSAAVLWPDYLSRCFSKSVMNQ